MKVEGDFLLFTCFEFHRFTTFEGALKAVARRVRRLGDVIDDFISLRVSLVDEASILIFVGGGRTAISLSYPAD